MTRSRVFLLAAVLPVTALFNACGGSDTTATVTVQETVTQAQGTGEQEAEPATTEPVDDVTTRDIVAAFKAAGLEAADARQMTKDDYGLAPLVAVEGTRFLIPSLGPDSGGRVMRFDSDADLTKTKAYYDDLGRESAAFFSWTFAEGNILVQINGELPESKARDYETALRDSV